MVDKEKITVEDAKFGGYDISPFKNRIDFDSIKDSTYQVNENILTDFIGKIYELDTKYVYTKRNTKNNNKIIIFNQDDDVPIIELTFDTKQNRLKISPSNDIKKGIFVSSNSDKKVELNTMFNYILDYILDLSVIHHKGILRILDNYINENDSELLKHDQYFVKNITLAKSARDEIFIQNYNILTNLQN